MKYVGVDGCPDGWFAVVYGQNGFDEAKLYRSDDGGFRELWEDLWVEAEDKADTILVDVPIGLWEENPEPRPCDQEARELLEYPRNTSVFAVPTRPAVNKAAGTGDYEDAKEVQLEATSGETSLGWQSFAICDKINELDEFIRAETDDDRRDVVRESHPEVCFWALYGEKTPEFSKNSQPAAAFWERVGVLEEAGEDNILNHLSKAGEVARDGKSEVSNDDILDSFALAVTAYLLRNRSGRVLGEPGKDKDSEYPDPKGLPMEMVAVE